MAYTKYSLTPANNTAAPPDGAPEGMLPSAVNDTMRDMMAQIRDGGDGVRDGTYTMTAPKITGGTITGVTLTGNTLTNPVITGATLTTSAFNGTVGATTASTGAFTTLSTSSTTTLSGLTASTALALDASKNVVSVTNTGTGNNVLSASPTLTGTIAGASLSLSSLTSGRVTYATTAGLLTDSANLTFNGTTLTANTIGAFTLGGTVAGGGNQLNNVIIGTSTPLAGAFTTLSATGVATFSAGTVSLPAITTTGDTNTGIFFPAADTIAFTEGGTEAMRVSSNGYLGIGSNSPTSVLQVGSGSITPAYTSGISQQHPYNPSLSLLAPAATAVSSNILMGDDVSSSLVVLKYTYSTKELTFNNQATSGYQTWFTGGSERMRIDSSGRLGIGTSSPTKALTVSTNTSTDGILITGSTNPRLQVVDTTNSVTLELISGDSQATIRTDTNHPIVFGTNGTERMTLDATGVVGIGITTAGSNAGVFSQLQIGGTSTANSRTLIYGQKNASAGGIISNGYYDASNNLVYSQTYGVSQLYLNNGTFIFSNAASGTAGTNVTVTEVMRIDADRNLCVGTTSSTAGSATVRTHISGTDYALGLSVLASGGQQNIRFINGTTAVGSVTTTSSATSYNTSSDQRLKTNVVDAPSGNIDNIKVRSFDWKADGSHQEYGVIAQELVTVAPYAVHQPKDTEEMMAVDYSKLVPMMIKEIQDLKAEINQLKAKIGV